MKEEHFFYTVNLLILKRGGGEESWRRAAQPRPTKATGGPSVFQEPLEMQGLPSGEGGCLCLRLRLNLPLSPEPLADLNEVARPRPEGDLIEPVILV